MADILSKPLAGNPFESLNLAFFMTAKNLLSNHPGEAILAMGLNEELAEFIRDLSIEQMMAIAKAPACLFNFRMDHVQMERLLDVSPNNLLARASMILASRDWQEKQPGMAA